MELTQVAAHPSPPPPRIAQNRKEASTHPSIYLASSNPYAVAVPPLEGPSPSLSSLAGPSLSHALHLPSDAWRTTFLRRFLALREALSNAPAEQRTGGRARIPKPRTSDAGHRAWYRFVWGCERPVDAEGEVVAGRGGDRGEEEDDDGEEDEDDEEGDEEMEHTRGETRPQAAPTSTPNRTPTPRLPTPALLARFTPPQTLALLEVIPYWMAIPGELLPGGPSASEGSQTGLQAGAPTQAQAQAIPPHLALWTFSLLARLDARLTSDEIATLRVLARAAIAAIGLFRRHERQRVSQGVPQGEQQGVPPGGQQGEQQQVEAEAEAGAWMVVCVVAGVWGQSDLWGDAAAEMRAVAAEAEAEAAGAQMEGEVR